jgi:hypothetical protein
MTARRLREDSVSPPLPDELGAPFLLLTGNALDLLRHLARCGHEVRVGRFGEVAVSNGDQLSRAHKVLVQTFEEQLVELLAPRRPARTRRRGRRFTITIQVPDSYAVSYPDQPRDLGLREYLKRVLAARGLALEHLEELP